MERLRARLEVKEGNLSYLRGDYKMAIAHYDVALRIAPSLATAHLNRAYGHVALFRQSEDPEERRRLAGEAIASFEKYLSLADGARVAADTQSPDRDKVEQHILTLYLDSQQQDRAIEFLQARLSRNPRDIPTLQMLSGIYSDRGDIEDALQCQRKRLEVQPNDPEAYYAVGVFAWQTSYHQTNMAPAQRGALLDEGLRVMRKALELRPDYFEALTYANLLYRQKAQYAEREADRKQFEALADSFRARALELRKASQGTGTGPVQPAGAGTASAGGDANSAGGASPPGAPPP